jgi:hypothetical protein
MEYEKETFLFTKQEIDYINNTIKELEPTIVVLTNRTFEIKHELTLTIIDGFAMHLLKIHLPKFVIYVRQLQMT